MTKHFTILFFAILMPFLLFAQKHQVRGVVTDANSGETLIGATVSYGDGKGVITDMDGRYYIKLDVGSYHFKVSYVGYLQQEADITMQATDLTQNFQLKTLTLTEVEVVADVAKTRETPVAFSTVQPIKLQEELASRDIPMILNKTPGAYATQQGGGDGDARINIRGFSQRNLAVMIDGIPVNDMENGWVYWSNWFGLDAVTRSIQVQRGLGASKLALPSVGGTMNIISKGIDANLGGTIKQEVGSDGYLRTSLGITTGLLKHGWGVTIAGSYKQGNGWVDNTWTKGWFFYLRVDKKLGRHLLTLSAMGAPQEHAQRSYEKSIATFDKNYASDLGIDTSKTGRSYGIRYNPNWGYLNRWTGSIDHPVYQENPEQLSSAMNFYFKPQLSLRDFWRINDKFYWSNIIYASFGQGGGTGTARADKNGTPGSATFITDPTNGQVDFQVEYDNNRNSSGLNPNNIALAILRSSNNNHYWYGLLSTFNWEINQNLTLSGGVDLRTYRAEHYRTVYDLLGGNYFLDNSNENRIKTQQLGIDDKIVYNDDALVRWGGLFTQLEFKKGNWTAFLNLTAALTGYQRIDYFRKKDVVIDGNIYNEAIGYGDIFYSNGTQNLTYYADSTNDSHYTSHDTTFVIRNGADTSYITNATAYDINSKQSRYTHTKWKWLPGFTVKGGLNYNIDDRNNVFLNLGYLSKAPRFANVFDNSNKLFRDIKNEIIQALEIGYSYNSKTIAINVNGYLTYWQNRPLDFASKVTIEEEQYSYNINGIDAFHKGVEIEFGWKPLPCLQWDRVLSIGDWRWVSGDSVYIYDDNNKLLTTRYFDAHGVHVGDAAQIQYMESIRWEIIKYLYVSGSFTLFTKNYSQFDPISLGPDPADPSYKYLDANGNPRDSWMLPTYFLVDLNAGYRFVFKKFKLDLRATVLNLLDRKYISDAQNNDSYSTTTSDFNAASAGVFFGQGRTFNVSIALSY